MGFKDSSVHWGLPETLTSDSYTTKATQKLHVSHITNELRRGEDDGVRNESVLVLYHSLHHRCLSFRWFVVVDDSDSPE
jgi:hypothetical protein